MGRLVHPSNAKGAAVQTKPLAVIVSGAPGAGKSTLATALAKYLHLPHIERDTFLNGVQTTFASRSIDRVKEGVMPYYELLAQMLDRHVSFVTDGTIYRGISESDMKKYVIDNAFAVNVHARAQNERQRFYEREMKREGWPNDWVKDHMKVLDEIYDQTVNPLDLGIPVIEVDANDAYSPSIAEVAETIRGMFKNNVVV